MKSVDKKKKGSFNRIFVNNYLSRVYERIRQFKSRPSKDDLQEIISAASLHASKVDPNAKFGPHQAEVTADKVERKLRSLMKRHNKIQKKITEKKLTKSQLGSKDMHAFECGNLITLIEKELMQISKAKGDGAPEKKEDADAEMENLGEHEDSREESDENEKEDVQREVESEEENEEEEGDEQEDAAKESDEQEEADKESDEQEADKESDEQENVDKEGAEEEDEEEEDDEQEDADQEGDEKAVVDQETAEEEEAEQEGSEQEDEPKEAKDVKSSKVAEDGKEVLSPKVKPRLVGNIPVATTPGRPGMRLNTELIEKAFRSELEFVKKFHRLPNESELEEILQKAYQFAIETDPEGKQGKHRDCPPDIKTFLGKRQSLLVAFKRMEKSQAVKRNFGGKHLSKRELHTIECANIIKEIDALLPSGGVKRTRKGSKTESLPASKKPKRDVAMKPAIVELKDESASKTSGAAATEEEEVVRPTAVTEPAEPEPAQDQTKPSEVSGQTESMMELLEMKRSNEDRWVTILDEQKRMMQQMLESQQRIEAQQQKFYTSFLKTFEAFLPAFK